MSRRLKKALDDAYDVCLEMKNFTANIIASDGKNNAMESDLNLNRKANNYINWYKQTFDKKKS